MQKKPVIFFLSKSGAGKDTQAELLIEKYAYDYINTGELFRDFISSRSVAQFSRNSIDRYEALGIRRIVNNGEFAPSISVIHLWREPLLGFISNHTKSNGIVLVGMARKLGEAMILLDFFREWPDANKYFRLVPVHLKVSDREVRRRLLSRRQCLVCKKIIFPNGAIPKRCMYCGGKLMRRKDDTLRGIASRLDEYREFVAPVLQFFQKHKILIEVNGEQSIEAVHKAVVRELGL
ncbi:MAG TPA: nucleoside monophosphate kinase [Candidatus Paceibacterota bacterium]